MDMQNMGAKKTCLMTDPNLVNLAPVKTAIDSLSKHGIRFEIYNKVRVEPTEQSLQDAIEFAKHGKFDAFIAVSTRMQETRIHCKNNWKIRFTNQSLTT
jgi:hydroxyacid-oxoacid transhydrogenase